LLAVGGIAIGGVAVGIFAYGGFAGGLHIMTGSVKDPQAVAFFDPWAELWTKWLAGLGMFVPVACGLMWLVIWAVFRLRSNKGNSIGEVITATNTDLAANVTHHSSTIEQQVRGPAMGIVATGVLIWILIAVFVTYLSITEGPPHPALYGKIFKVMSVVVASATFLIFAGVKMMNLQSYKLSTAASVVAIVVSPLNLIGLPIGIWALVVLTRQDVKAAFSRTEDRRSETDDTLDIASIRLRLKGMADALTVIACIALLTAIGVGVWLGFASAAPFLERQDRFTLVSMSITHAVYALFILTAAIIIRQLRARLFSLLCITIMGLAIPAVLALNCIMEAEHIPQWPVMIPLWLGMPVSLWATILLFRDDVREIFSEQASRRASDLTVTETETSSEKLILLQVKRPAIGLFVLGGLNLFLILMYTLGTLVQWEEEGWVAAWNETLEMGPIVLTGMALSVPFSIVMILAGVLMIRLRSFGFAITAGIVDLIPFSFTFVFGLPIGIWVLVVLTGKDVKDAFTRFLQLEKKFGRKSLACNA
jgi:hypothetical protein